MSAHGKTSLDARVLMVSTSYPADSSDWRGIFIRHLAEALARRRDIDLRLWSPPGNMPADAAFVATETEQRWLKELMRKGGIAHLMRTQRMRGLAAAVRLLVMLRQVYGRESSASVFHVNWLQNAIPLTRSQLPVLATVLGTDMQLLKLPLMTAWLRHVFKHRAVAICPNAEWMVEDLERRFGDVASIRFVPFGIEPRWFQLQRAPVAPARWLCVSRITKGKIGTLFEWCEPYFADGRRELHLLGPMQQTIGLPPWVHYHGATTPDDLCRRWFPSAQGLISLSRHAEGRPQVLLEAMAGGLPIIASAIPAHADMLAHRDTGWLCSNINDVGKALDVLDHDPANLDMGLRAQARVKLRIGTWDDCAERYANEYHDLLSAKT